MQVVERLTLQTTVYFIFPLPSFYSINSEMQFAAVQYGAPVISVTSVKKKYFTVETDSGI
jgi:hypothetical protein